MKEISNALSDAIFTACNKIISKAKFDKTYKCRVINKISDGKYVVMKDNVEHTASSIFEYHPDDIVTVLLPQNSWTNATIVYPQDNTNKIIQHVNDNIDKKSSEIVQYVNNSINETNTYIDNNIANINTYVNDTFVPIFNNQSGRYIMNDICTMRNYSQTNVGTIKISVPPLWMGNLYIDIWSYSYRGFYIAGGYSYGNQNSWFLPQAMCLTPTGNVLSVRFAEDADKNKYILIGTTTTNYSGYLGVSLMKAFSNYTNVPQEDFNIELVTDESDLTITATF